VNILVMHEEEMLGASKENQRYHVFRTNEWFMSIGFEE
jgi:hypothetical protein